MGGGGFSFHTWLITCTLAIAAIIFLNGGLPLTGNVVFEDISCASDFESLLQECQALEETDEMEECIFYVSGISAGCEEDASSSAGDSSEQLQLLEQTRSLSAMLADLKGDENYMVSSFGQTINEPYLIVTSASAGMTYEQLDVNQLNLLNEYLTQKVDEVQLSPGEVLPGTPNFLEGEEECEGGSCGVPEAKPKNETNKTNETKEDKGLDPMLPAGVESEEQDSDKDGFTDIEEILGGTDPKDSKSKPSETKDSDEDGIKDAEEVRKGSDPNDKESTPESVKKAKEENEPKKDDQKTNEENKETATITITTRIKTLFNFLSGGLLFKQELVNEEGIPIKELAKIKCTPEDSFERNIYSQGGSDFRKSLNECKAFNSREIIEESTSEEAAKNCGCKPKGEPCKPYQASVKVYNSCKPRYNYERVPSGQLAPDGISEGFKEVPVLVGYDQKWDEYSYCSCQGNKA